MAILEVTCTHCSRVTKIPAAKVPDHPVAYRCPACKGKIVIDKKKILAASRGVGLSAAVPSDSSGHAGLELPSATVEVEELMLPPGESLPPGLLVTEDEALATQLVEVVQPYDCNLERVASVEDVRRRARSDVPPLVVYLAKSIGQPPYAPLAPLLGLPPRERRQIFIALVAADAATNDGNQAFLFQVNLLLDHQHIPKAAGLLYSGLRYHRRLYRAYFEALGEDR